MARFFDLNLGDSRLIQQIDLVVAFASQPRQCGGKLLPVLFEHFFINDSLRAGAIVAEAGCQRDVENQGDNRQVIGARHSQQRPPRAKLQIGRINDRQPLLSEPQPGDVMQQTERLRVDCLITFVVANQRAAMIGRDDLGGRKMPGGKG